MNYMLEVYVPAWDRKHPQVIASSKKPYQAFAVGQRLFIADEPMGSPFGYEVESVSHVVSKGCHGVMLQVRELSA